MFAIHNSAVFLKSFTKQSIYYLRETTLRHYIFNLSIRSVFPQCSGTQWLYLVFS